MEHFKSLHEKFIAAGKAVKEAVDRRAQLHQLLENQQQQFHQLQVAEQESGLDDIDQDDPLYFIEANYPFHPDALECSPENVSNMEDPKRCVESMTKFAKVLQDNIHRFKHLPKGPLYMEVKIRNKKWAPLAEYVLRPYLFSFLVDNIVDGLVIQELIDEHFPSSKGGCVNAHGVVCPKYHVFEYNNPLKIESRLTAMQGLELENMLESLYCDDEDWGKFLSSMINVEKIIFMENENAAFLVMSHIQKTPWHCNMAYTLDGFCVLPFPAFRTKKIYFHPRPMYLKCLPNNEILECLIKIRRTEIKIDQLNKEINKKRDLQFDVLDELENKNNNNDRNNNNNNGPSPKKVKPPVDDNNNNETPKKFKPKKSKSRNKRRSEKS